MRTCVVTVSQNGALGNKHYEEYIQGDTREEVLEKYRNLRHSLEARGFNVSKGKITGGERVRRKQKPRSYFRLASVAA